MSDCQNKFTLHDTTFIIRTNVASDAVLYDKIKSVLRGMGFTWTQHPEIKKSYPILAKTHHYGQCKGLEFDAKICPALIELAFYQNQVFENPNGGKYDFSKRSKMPYLTRLRFLKAVSRIKALLASEGFADASRPHHRTAHEAVAARRAEWQKTHPRTYTDPLPDYNSRDGDKNILKDGDVRYFYDYHGRLARGTVCHNANNMWWVVSNDSTYSNIWAGGLFAWKPGLARRLPRDTKDRLESHLAKAVKAQDFERAIIFRDLLKKKAV